MPRFDARCSAMQQVAAPGSGRPGPGERARDGAPAQRPAVASGKSNGEQEVSDLSVADTARPEGVEQSEIGFEHALVGQGAASQAASKGCSSLQPALHLVRQSEKEVVGIAGGVHAGPRRGRSGPRFERNLNAGRPNP